MPLHGRFLHGGRMCLFPFHVSGQSRLDGTLQFICTKGEYFYYEQSGTERRPLPAAKREAAEKREDRCAALGSLAEVFSYRKMFFYGRKCCNGVRWKQSAQNFEMHLFSGTARRRREILNGTWKPKKCVHLLYASAGRYGPLMRRTSQTGKCTRPSATRSLYHSIPPA